MNTAERLRSAFPAILLAQIVKALFALALLGELGNTLRAASLHGAPSSGSAWLLALGLTAHPRWTAAAQWVALLYLFLSPLLTQLILVALRERAVLGAQLRAALVRYPQALALGAAALLALGPIVVGAAIGAARLPALVPPGPALEESVRYTCIALGLCAALFTTTAFDLGAARVAHGPTTIARALGIALRATRLGPCALHAGFIAAATGFYALSDLAVRDSVSPWLALALQQSLSLAGMLARAAWLARALAIASPNEPT